MENNKYMKKKTKKQNNKNLFESKNDPLGSYTGTNLVDGEVPVQDADDL